MWCDPHVVMVYYYYYYIPCDIFEFSWLRSSCRAYLHSVNVTSLDALFLTSTWVLEGAVYVCMLLEAVLICWSQQSTLTMSYLMTSGETSPETSCLSVRLAQQTARNVISSEWCNFWQWIDRMWKEAGWRWMALSDHLRGMKQVN